MGYLQALQLLTRAYKAARGVMPKGLDLLKLKQKARQKVIDSKKVINVDFSKGRKFYEEGIGDLIQKGKLFVGKAPKTKKIKPAVDPKLIQQESIKDVYKRLMRSNREAVKVFKKRNEAKKDLGDRLKDYKGDPDAMREGGIISLANGGLTNISQTYDNNPTLQAQYPNKQDYLDLFSSQTTTTTPQTNTTTQSTTSTIAPINPIKPIIKIPQEGGDGGGGITKGGPNRFDYGYTSLSDDLVQGESAKGGYRTPGTEANINFLADIAEGTIPDEDYGKIEELKDTFYGVKSGLGNFYKTVSPFLNAKRALAKGQDFALDIIQKAKDAAAARELAKLQEAARAAGFQGDTRTDAETSFASSQTYGGGGSGRDQGADTFDI